ncbi:MAG TPA: hypothetical protein EYO58_12025 [Flavobacteriales bacterium]|nr:hypothetical protein [Flavobacteriales bacterium]
MNTVERPTAQHDQLHSEIDFVAKTRQTNKSKLYFLVRLKEIMEQRAESMKKEIIRLNAENEQLIEKYYKLSDELKSV